MNDIKSQRNYGMDLFRILSMFMVIMLHIVNQCGIVGSTPQGSLKNGVAWYVLIGTICAVNCFALASGYLISGRKFKYRKIANLWIVVMFYTVIFMIFGLLFVPGSVNVFSIFNLTPILTGSYWYFTAYVCLCLFIPVLNFLIDTLPKNSFYTLLITGFMVFSVIQMFSIRNSDSFNLNVGYSGWWLMYLYLLGAGIKKYNMFTKLKASVALIGYLLTILLAVFCELIVRSISTSGIPLISALANYYGEGRFYQYISPTIVVASVFLMVFFLKIKVPEFLKKPLVFIAPLCFQIYIIHSNPVFWRLFIGGKYEKIASFNVFVMILGIIGVTLAIFTACILIDIIRFYLFRWLKVDKAVDRVADKILLKLKEKTKVS